MSRLRMKALDRCQWRHSGVSLVNCEHISRFALIAEFEQANVCWEKRNSEKTNNLKTRSGISCVML